MYRTAVGCLLIPFFVSCGQSDQQVKKLPSVVLPPTSTLGTIGTEELMNLVAHYLSLKDALAMANTQKADEASSKVMSAAEIFLAEHATSALHPELRPDVQQVMKLAEAIIHLYPENIGQRRLLFSDLSQHIFSVLRRAKVSHAGLYWEYCSQSFGGKGAHWLSRPRDTSNPYFGSLEPECAVLVDSF
ncbi:MAG: DUF3347 domain-containing protein [Bacteroidetes bacterium]|nr:DUF3347 domain-containing protein [Bacteroidota bacterium]